MLTSLMENGSSIMIHTRAASARRLVTSYACGTAFEGLGMTVDQISLFKSQRR